MMLGMWRSIGRWIGVEALGQVFRALVVPMFTAAAAAILYVVFFWASGPLWMRITLLVAVPSIIFVVGLIGLMLIARPARADIEGDAESSAASASAQAEPKGWLDNYVDAVRDLKRFAEALSLASDDANWANKRTVKHSKSIADSVGNPQRMHKHAKEAGDDFLEFARRISTRNPELEATANAPHTFALYLEESPGEADIDDLYEFRKDVSGGLETVQELRKRMESLRESMGELRSSNVSADLNRGASESIEALGETVRIMKRLEHSLEELMTAIARTTAAGVDG